MADAVFPQSSGRGPLTHLLIMMIIDEDGNNNCGRLRCWRYGIVVVLIFVYHCGVVLILLVDKSIVVLFWYYYWLTRA